MSSLANSQSIVAVQLPSLFPDVAWIRNLMSSNLLVIQDHLVFSRKSRVHRGKIRTPDGTQWIHIPIHPEDRNLPLYLCRIDHQTDWMTPLWRSLEYNYRNSIYFDFYEPEILGIFQEVKKMKLFSEIHEFLYQTWLTLLEIEDVKCVYSSSKLGQVSSEMPDPLDYITELGSANLIIREIQSKNYQPPIHRAVEIHQPLPEYHQHFDGFVPNCCVLDLLFQNGPESWRILDELVVNLSDFQD